MSLDTSACYVDIDPSGRHTVYAINLESTADSCRIENYLPVLAESGRAIEEVMHAWLMESNIQPWDRLETETEWGILLDRRQKLLMVYGFGGRWRLPDSAASRFALPLLRSLGWRDWRVEHVPRGTWAFDRYLEQGDPGWSYRPFRFSWPLHRFWSYLPKDPDTWFENLLVSIRQDGAWRHYFFAGEDGYDQLETLIGRGASLIDEFACFPECELPYESDLRCSLRLDADQRRLAYYVDAQFDNQLFFDPEEIAWRWPGWRLELLPDYESHLREVKPVDAALLLLTPEALQAWIRTELESDLEAWPFNELGKVPKEALTLGSWFEEILLHPKLGKRLIAEWRQALPMPDAPVPCFDPDPGHFPVKYSGLPESRPRSEAALTRTPEPLLMLYDCLYGHPPWLAEALSWPKFAPPSAAELTIQFDLLARDPELRWRWLWLFEGFLLNSAEYKAKVLRTRWPQGAQGKHEDWALAMSTPLLQACLRHLASERELSCLLRIARLCPRLAHELSLEALPPIGDHPARQTAHRLSLQETLSGEPLDEADRAQLLALLPELTPVQQLAWLKRSRKWPPTEHNQVIHTLVLDGGPALHAQIAGRLPRDEAFIRSLVSDWLLPCSPEALAAWMKRSGSCDLLLRLMELSPYEAFWPVALALIEADDPVLLRELYQRRERCSADFCRELVARRFGTTFADHLAAIKDENQPQRIRVWLALSARAQLAPRLALGMLQGPHPEAWPLALEALSEWSQKPDFERLCQELDQPEAEPLVMLAHLLSAKHWRQPFLLHLLLMTVVWLGLEAEALPLLAQWIQTRPEYGYFESTQNWFKYVLKPDQTMLSRFYQLWAACYGQLPDLESRRWLLSELRDVRRGELHTAFWQAYRQDEDADLKLMAAIALAKQGQAEVKPALEAAGDKLWSYEGLEALHGIKEKAWAKAVYDQMRRSGLKESPWHGVAWSAPLDVQLDRAASTWGYHRYMA